jgi:uncharacterized protein YybS (DUF2232 family)
MVGNDETVNPQRRLHPGPALAGFLSFAAVASLVFVPLLGAFIAMLAAVPLVYLVAEGRPSILGWGWVSIVLAGAALLWGGVWVAAALLAYLLLAVLPAVSVEAWVRRPWSTGRWVAGIAAVAFVALAGFLIAIFYPASPPEEMARRLTAALAETVQAMGAMGGGLGADELLAQGVQLAAYLAPALGATYVLSAALWVRPRLPLLGLPRGEEPYALYSSEEWLPVPFAIGGLGWVFAHGLAKWLSTNLFVTVLGLYFLHGLAIIHFYLGRRFGTNRWVRLAVALFALQIPVALALSALGLTDAFVRLRRGGAYDGGSEA